MTTTVSERQALIDLAMALPESEIHAARRFLEYLMAQADPVALALLTAEYDDEPTTPEEDDAVDEAYEAISRGEVQSLEDVRRELLSRSAQQRMRPPPGNPESFE